MFRFISRGAGNREYFNCMFIVHYRTLIVDCLRLIKRFKCCFWQVFVVIVVVVVENEHIALSCI